MKRSELKLMIKECVKEILFEDGILSTLVAEVAVGITKAQTMVTEQKKAPAPKLTTDADRAKEETSRRNKLLESKRKLLEAMGSSKMSNVFEGTEPLRSGGQTGAPTTTGPLAGRDPTDAGVDISDLFSVAGKKWTALK